MAQVQTSYQERMPVAVAGMPATMSGWDVDTKLCETDAGIPFGRAVSQGAADRGVVLGGTGFLGVSMRDPTLPPSSGDINLDNMDMGVLVRGDIWVEVSADVAVGDAVAYNTTTGLFGAGQAIPNARWMTSADANGLAILRLAGGIGGVSA